MMNNKINPFIKPIVMKKSKWYKNFKARSEYKKLIKDIDKISPSYNTMLEINEFLSLLRSCYMYVNDSNISNLFLADAGKPESCAMIYKGNGFSIIYLMYKRGTPVGGYAIENIQVEEHIDIEISRDSKNNKKDKEQINIIDGEWIDNMSKYDEEKLIFIISCLMGEVKKLVKYYYKNKKF